MLVIRPVTEVFSLPVSLAVIKSGKLEESFGIKYGKRGGFNAGFILLGAEHLGGVHFDAVEVIMDKGRTNSLRDQPIFNELFLDHDKLFLPQTYNWKMAKKWGNWEGKAALKYARVIHFVGTSKWCLAQAPTEKNPLQHLFHEIRNRHHIPHVLDP
jgi:lipopolysaccharide biosynthesis glycosyltransferase